MRSFLCAGLCALALPTASFAETDTTRTYIGGSLGVTYFEADALPDWEQRYIVASLRLGAQFHENVSGELRLGKGLTEHDDRLMGVDTSTELEHYYGAYIKVTGGDDVRPYLLAGYNKIKLGLTATNGSITAGATDTEGDIAFGLGLDFDLEGDYMVNVECISQYDKDEETINGCNVGFARWF